MAIESVNPATGERLATFPETPAAEVDRIVSAAVTAQKAWARQPFSARATPMRRVAALLKERAQELARLAALEMGKPLKDGAGEVNKCAWVCEWNADNAEKLLAPREETSDGSRAFVRFDPLGVVLAVMPWNFPYWQVFRFIAPHLMAGNAGILKHASNVPQCALAIERAMHDAGFPRDLFRTVLVGSKAIRGLIGDPRIAAVTITGSEPAGRDVAEAAGKNLKPSVMELGGSDPFIVLADADLDEAARVGSLARVMNAGQSCICAKRFIVEAPVYEVFVQKLTANMQKVKVGDPLDPATDIGPQARRELRDELHGQVQLAIKQGAKPVLGCSIPAGSGAFYPASVLRDVRPDNVAAKEEIFGPVAAILRAEGADQAIELANATRFGLGASLWTRDPAKIERLVPLIEAGAVFVNGLVKSDPRLPFGGVKASGFGRELGLEGIRSFCNAKTVWIK
jgi:succinate-semialdehyde dehydrogenase/glutarate-semialdehyde dehydrogenase